MFMLIFAEPANLAAQTVIKCDSAGEALAGIAVHVTLGSLELVSINTEFPERTLTIAQLEALAAG